jgi:hypothetical protein
MEGNYTISYTLTFLRTSANICVCLVYGVTWSIGGEQGQKHTHIVVFVNRVFVQFSQALFLFHATCIATYVFIFCSLVVVVVFSIVVNSSGNSRSGCAIAEAVSRWLPTAAARVWQVGFVVDEVASWQVFSEYFGFPCQNPFIPPTSSSQSPGAVSRGLATSWSPIQGVLLTVLDLVTEMKRKVSWRRPRPKIGQ